MLIPPLSLSSRLKGEDPQLTHDRPTPPQPILRLAAEVGSLPHPALPQPRSPPCLQRGYEPTGNRDVVSGELETYTDAHRQLLCSRGAYTAWAPSARPGWEYRPDLAPCQHCRLRVSKHPFLLLASSLFSCLGQSTQPMSACSQCAGPHGAICGRCLWERYGENVTELAPDWQCPHCRGICMCSECRTRRGFGALGPGKRASSRPSRASLTGQTQRVRPRSPTRGPHQCGAYDRGATVPRRPQQGERPRRPRPPPALTPSPGRGSQPGAQAWAAAGRWR